MEAYAVWKNVSDSGHVVDADAVHCSDCCKSAARRSEAVFDIDIPGLVV